MPRNITITFNDGSAHRYENIPDTVTPDQIEARVKKDFPAKTIKNIDGGKTTTSQYQQPSELNQVKKNAGVQSSKFAWKDNEDKMTGKKTGKYSSLMSVGRPTGELYLQPNGAWIDTSEIISFKIGSGGWTANGRLKVDNGPVEVVALIKHGDGFGSAQIGFDPSNAKKIVNTILMAQSEIKLEVPIYRQGNRIFIFKP